MSKPKFVYVTYIRTTPEKLWAALTDPQTIEEILVRHFRRKRLEAGLVLALKFEDGRTADTGEILEADPPQAAGHRLAQRVQAGAEGRRLLALHDGDRAAEYYPGYGGKAVKLTITHEVETERARS